MNIRTPALLLALLVGCAKTEPPGPAHVHEQPQTTKAAVWYCPMHPSYRSDHPGDCPICNMKLLPLEEGGERHATSGVEGRAAITITPEKRQLIGVRTAVVEKTDFARTIRAAGRVDFDERKLSALSLKFGGWIEELFVRSTGESVKKGDPLLAIWSPELYEAQRAYRIALSAGAGDEGARSARKRLLAWDLSEEQVRELEGMTEPDRRATILSKAQGVVTRREATVGGFVEPGKTLYEIADLSTVWVHADVYENELALVRVGQEASIELASLPGERIAGRIVYVYPYLSEATRTARVRIEVDNPEGRLKPGMYATVSIAADLGEQVVIDDGAVLDTGTRQIVFVEKDAGRFEPREVVIGDRSDGRAVVKKGLEPGEKVVTSANFLVDSESRLRSALEQHASGAHQH